MKRIKTEIIRQAHDGLDEANRQIREFQQLSDENLRHRPQPNQWNVLDCLEHINLSYGDYFPRMEQAVRKASPTDRATYTPGLFGQWFAKGQRPQQGQRKMKMKTFKNLVPYTDQKKTASIFEEVLQYHAQFKSLLDRSADLDWNRVKVVSEVGPILRFKLGDCFRLLVAHTERHVLQAQEVLSTRPTETQSVKSHHAGTPS